MSENEVEATIPYTLPTIGSVNIELKGPAAELYRILTERHEIDRLRQLKHLGILQPLFPGIPHTRWDYTVAMLYVVEQLTAASLKGYTSARTTQELDLSSRDRLQLLALVCNIGHLPGTFAVEKGVMRFLWQRENTWADILELLDGGTEIGRESLDYTRLNRLLAILKLRQWQKTSDSSANLLQVCTELLFHLLFRDNLTEYQQQVVEYFNIIRRVAYQFLDCLYIRLPVRLDYSRLFVAVTEQQLFSEELPAFRSLIEHYTRIVYRQIYHSTQVRETVARCSIAVVTRLQEADDPLETLLGWLEESDPESLKLSLAEPGLSHPFATSIPFASGSVPLVRAYVARGVDRLEQAAAEALGEDSVLPLMLYVPSLHDPITGEIAPGELIVDLWTKDLDSLEKKHLLVQFVLFCLRQYDALGSGIFLKSLCEAILHSITEACDKVAIEPASAVFFTPDAWHLQLVPEDAIKAFSTPEKDTVLELFREQADSGWGKQEQERFHEVALLKTVIEDIVGSNDAISPHYIMIPGSIRFFTGDVTKCEFDGGLLEISTARHGQALEKVRLFLLEAKSGRKSGRGESSKELKEKLDALGVQSFFVHQVEPKHAVAEITLI